jgi:DnaJ-class molecular chaperone
MKWRNRPSKFSDEIARLKSLEPHEVLRIPPTSSLVEIKCAYRNMVKVYHPDASDPFMKEYNEEVFKIITCAYELLLQQNKS